MESGGGGGPEQGGIVNWFRVFMESWKRRGRRADLTDVPIGKLDEHHREREE